ncbi:MAG: hypothetical protein ACM3SY_06920 [Candidatus Omnitrophota bacterium]
MQYEVKQRTFTETVRESFRIYADNFKPLFLISLINSIPAALVPPMDTVGASPEEQGLYLAKIVPWLIVFMFINTISSAIMTEYISKRYVNREQHPMSYIQDIQSLLIPIMGLALVQTVMVTIVIIPMFFPILFILFIPMIYLMLAFSLAVPAVIVERRGLLDAMKRSLFLTHRKKLEIFLYLTVYFLILLSVSMAGKIINAILEVIGVGRGVLRLIDHLVQVFAFPVNACLFLLIYFNIRIQKERIDTAENHPLS